MSNIAYIGIGSNLGDRIANYKRASAEINGLPETRVTRQSSVYESEPHGRARNWFLNGVVEVSTELDPKELLKALQKIETAMGRKKEKSKKSVSRVIDLDILMYGADVVEGRTLKVPHPEMQARRFVLMPLAELAPQAKHPVLGETVSDLLVACEDDKKIHLFKL